MKKHLLAFVVLASVFCSCRKDYTPTRKEGLTNYAYTLFYDMVTAPAVAMDIAYEFQNFLSLSDEQRKKHKFANMFVQYDFTKYALLLYEGSGYFEERVWLARTAGSETEAGASGIRSDYCTYSIMQGEDDFEISFQKHAADDIRACSFNGTFLVLISSFDEIKERALVFGKPGFAVNCIVETLE